MQSIAEFVSGVTTAGATPSRNGSVLLFEAHPNLSGVPDILARVTPAELRRVAAAGQKISFNRGDHLFRQGEPHRGIFVLRTGIVRSFYVSPSGREITLANWKPGNFVGGPEIFGSGLHVWSGIAVEAGEAIRLSGPAVRQLTTEIPNFAVGLVDGLAFKGKCYSALLQMLGTRSILERLAHLLFNLAEEQGSRTPDGILIEHAPTHEELAAMVGATRQWISMTMERFRASGLIDVNRRRIIFLRLAALRVLAGGEGIIVDGER
ncbi:MAG TPA: Crp/Fnr family transcriptional regulator [Xanthobacteraceae bacterium]|nr:Crp/Fnr family transcriptional regulator [Xanthobacteraceae bacterium]